MWGGLGKHVAIYLWEPMELTKVSSNVNNAYTLLILNGFTCSWLAEIMTSLALSFKPWIYLC